VDNDVMGNECPLHGVHHHHHVAKAAVAALVQPTMTDETDAEFHC
jgi:hypothetical protein